MHGWHKLWAGAIVLATALLIGPSAASAQTLVKYNEGPGLKLSNSVVLHGGAAVMGSYDTNVFYGNQGAVGSFFLTPIAHVDLATLPPQRLEGQPEGPTQSVDFRLRFAAPLPKPSRRASANGNVGSWRRRIATAAATCPQKSTS